MRYIIQYALPYEHRVMVGTGDWPDPDASVKAIRRRAAAFLAAYLLVEAYRHGEGVAAVSTGMSWIRPIGLRLKHPEQQGARLSAVLGKRVNAWSSPSWADWCRQSWLIGPMSHPPWP